MPAHTNSTFIGHIKRVPSYKSKTKKKRDKRNLPVLRKAPQAPKRFKSSYIFFFTSKQREIKDALGEGATVGAISKKSSEMWKALPPKERSYWDDVAKKDKKRYMKEKSEYSGPWQIPWTRSKKDPSAPKRAMSAFLFFCKDKRKKIKDERPGILNTELSSILGEMWRNSSDDEKKPYVDNEIREREKYKIAMAKWKVEEVERKAKGEEMIPEVPDLEPLHSTDYHYPLHQETYQSNPIYLNDAQSSSSQLYTDTQETPNYFQFFDDSEKWQVSQTQPNDLHSLQQLGSLEPNPCTYQCTQNNQNPTQFQYNNTNLYHCEPQQEKSMQCHNNYAIDPYSTMQVPEHASTETSSPNMAVPINVQQDVYTNKPYYNYHHNPSNEYKCNYDNHTNLYADNNQSTTTQFQNCSYL